jgi:uncharacterized protein (TIGR02246 family)
MKAISFFFTLSIVFIFSNVLTAQAEMSPDEMAIRQIVQDMQDGWNAKSGQQFASHFAEDHSYVVWNGMYMPHMDRAGNSQAHQQLYNGVYKDMNVEFKVDNVRFVQTGIAFVHTLAIAIHNGIRPEYPGLLQTMLLEKQGEDWKIVSFHNLDIEYDKLLRKPEPTETEKLAFAKQSYPGWYR